ncbi:MAG: hypothetical protein P4L46_25815 [Fimbriimonas sp.]|nr:hypothetical protein [Fimbriimonas sp.]
MVDRRYTEEELRTILREASTAQASDLPVSADSGFTLSEIKQLGSEVGLDPNRIEMAAGKLPEQIAPPSPFTFWGVPNVEAVEQSFEGKLSDDAWTEVIEDLRIRFGDDGSSTCQPDLREWTGGTDTLTTHVSATTRGNKTVVRIHLRRLGGISIAWSIGLATMFLVTLVLTILTHKQGLSVGIGLAAAGIVDAALYGLTRWAVTSWAHRHASHVHAIFDRVAEGIGQQESEITSAAAKCNDAAVQRLTGQT